MDRVPAAEIKAPARNNAAIAAVAFQAREGLQECRLCAWDCGVNRRVGARGRCHADEHSRIFHQGIEWAGEEALVPTYVISFAGCNMSCPFCLTGDSSQRASSGRQADAACLDAIAAEVAARSQSLRSVTILGGEPSIHLHTALDLIARLPAALPVVWKTNAYASRQALDLLAGHVDVVLADYKFGNDGCAARLGGIPHYLETLHENLRWARDSSKLIIRHLLMPGHLDCCLTPALDWIGAEMPEVAVSVMTGFLPLHRSHSADLGRTNSAQELAEAEAAVSRSAVSRAPWAMRAGSDLGDAAGDEFLIDASGRICVDSASPALLACLERLRHEMSFGS